MQDIVSHSVSYSRKKLQVANHVQNPPLYSYEHDTHLRATCICFTAHEWKVQNLSRQGNSLRVFWTHDKTTRANFVWWYSEDGRQSWKICKRFLHDNWHGTHTDTTHRQIVLFKQCCYLIIVAHINQSKSVKIDHEWLVPWKGTRGHLVRWHLTFVEDEYVFP